MISIKGINKYTAYEKMQLRLALLAILEDIPKSDDRYNCVKFFVNGYTCTNCKYKHLCKDINDILKSGILDESEVKK